MKNAIFCTVDDNYIKYLIPFINSIKKNFPNHPEIIIYYLGAGQDIKKKMRAYDNVKLVNYQLDIEKLKGLSLGVVNNPAIFVRYALWSSDFDEYDNILHLDVDSIILKPLDSLLHKSDFFCVSDHSNTPQYRLFDPEKYDKRLVKMLAQDNIDFFPSNQDDMINAGVFLIPKKYRTKYYADQLWYLNKRYNKYLMFADQSAISLWCHLNRIPITKEYHFNFQVPFLFSDSLFYSKFYCDFDLENIHILHFCWWKFDEENYEKFKKLSSFFLSIDQLLSKFKHYLE